MAGLGLAARGARGTSSDIASSVASPARNDGVAKYASIIMVVMSFFMVKKDPRLLP